MTAPQTRGANAAAMPKAPLDMLEKITTAPGKVAANIKAEAAAIVYRLGHEVDVAEVETLADQIATVATERAQHCAACKSFLSRYRHPEDAARAYGGLIRHVAPILADMAVTWIWSNRPIGERVEISAYDIPQKVQSQIAGTIGREQDRRDLTAFVAKHWGWANLYVGIQPRKPNFGGKRRSNAKDVQAHMRVFLDIDRDHTTGVDGQEIPEDRAAWEQRRDAMIDRLLPLGPSAAIASGEGVQVIFDVEATTALDEIGRRCGALKAAGKIVGSDDVHDLVRIGRLPFTINIPTKAKQRRGRKVSLALPIDFSQPTKVWDFDALMSELGGSAPEPAKPAKTPVPNTDIADELPAREVSAPKVRTPSPADRRAPTPELADAALGSLSNDPDATDWPYADRAAWVRIAHFHRGAGGTLPAWLEWCAQANGDPVEDERVWETLDPENIGAGWRELVDETVRQKTDFAEMHRAEIMISADAAFAADPDAETIRTVAERHIAGQAQSRRRGGQDTLEFAATILENRGVSLWRDENGAAHATIPRTNGVVEHVALDDADGLTVIQAVLAAAGLMVLGQKARDLKELLAARAAMGGVVRTAAIRVAAEPERIWLDRGASDGIVYELSASGIRRMAMTDCPTAFIRPSGTTPLPDIPAAAVGSSGSNFLKAIDPEVNLPAIALMGHNDVGIQARAVLLTFLVSATYRIGTTPHLMVGGPAGSGKTTFVRRLLDLLAPTTLGVLGDVRDAKHLAVLAHWLPLVGLDNVAGFNREVQDGLCRLATGASWADRRLYHDGALVAWRLHRPVVATAIGGFGTVRGDLADRSLWLTLAPHGRAWSEAAAERRWTAALPAIFGALLGMLASGLARRATVDAAVDAGLAPAASPRYRDVAVLAEACARAEGWPDWLLWSALAEIRRTGQADVAGANPFVGRLAAIVKAKGGAWTATAANWHEEVTAPGLLPSWGPRGAPRSAQSWGLELQGLETTLRELGWTIDRGVAIGRDKAKRRGIAITAPAAALDEVPDVVDL